MIFMLHRFRDPERGTAGHNPAALRRDLAYLREEQYDLVSVDELLRRLEGEGQPLRRAVAFTIDDGYVDQASVAAPVFAEFDCPVTTFVTTGFLDGDIWFWWDQIEYVFLSTSRFRLECKLAGAELCYRWSNAPERSIACADFTERCKRVSDQQKHLAIAALAVAAEVELPERAPSQYAPMSWDQLRCCEGQGMTFGPHTVTHPILSRVDDDQARWELAASWERLQAEAQDALPVFCYPNGGQEDFSDRETACLSEIGLRGAMVGSPGYARGEAVRKTPDARYRIPRFSYSERRADLIQCTSGFERFKQILRREVA